MTPTSATKADTGQAAELLAVIARRASHEVRNALNSVAVNIEVVRSRMARPEPNLSELQNFAERASTESDAAAALTTGLADLTGLFAMVVMGEGKAQVSTATGSKVVSVPLCASDDHRVSADLKALAERMGVSIKLDGATVIFTVRD